MAGNGEQMGAEELAKIARISNLADSEDYKLHVYQETDNAYILGFITKAQRDTIYSILFAGDPMRRG